MATAYERINDTLIDRLEAGVIPWKEPWNGLPRNLVSEQPYRGVNALVLGAQEHTEPWWLTYRQARKLGGHVKQGERGTPVVYWRPPRDDDQQERKYPVLRTYTVFNIEQTKGIEAPTTPAINDDLEGIVKGMPNPPTISNGQAAGYATSKDTVYVPPRSAFRDEESYYATLFHELAHSTGHETRLDRRAIREGATFGSPRYAREELTAEIGAAYLCGHTGIIQQRSTTNAAYINNWLGVLQANPRLVIHTASDAQKAADYIIGARENRDDAAP